MRHLLDNVVWHALSGAQARFAVGTATARRYAPGFSGLIGFADNSRPDFDALTAYCAPGEPFYCAGWSGPVPAGWSLQAESTMCRMVWTGPAPASEDDGLEAVPLGTAHAAAAMDLVALTRPGPFGPRTLELGDYFGVFDGARLVAMAGERLAAGPLREVSGVCTHPDFQGRGLARRLMLKLVRRQCRRGETPFLHVMSANTVARRLYEDMGFAIDGEPLARVVARDDRR